MDKAGDHGVEVVSPVVAPGETGEVALGMVGTELSVGPGDRALDVAERRIDPLNEATRAALGPEPVRTARWVRRPRRAHANSRGRR